MKPTWRRTAWPSEAAFCSAKRSGSARRMATSVMVEDRRRSSSVRQASKAINHSSAMGTTMAAMVRNVVGRVTRSSQPSTGASLPIETRANAAPMAAQMMLAMVANLNGAFDGFCCSAKMRPPMLGPSSLAAMRLREGPAGRRRAMRRRGAAVAEGSVSAGASMSGFSPAGCSGGAAEASDVDPEDARGRGGGTISFGGVCSNGGSLASSAEVVLGALPSVGIERVGSGRTSPSCASSLLLSCAIAPSMPDASPARSKKSTRPNGLVPSKSKRRVALSLKANSNARRQKC